MKSKFVAGVVALLLTTLLSGQSDLQRVLTDSTIWGKDLGVLLVQLRAFQDAGERTVYVFPDRIVGRTAHVSTAEGQRAAGRLNGAIPRSRQSRLKAPYAALATTVPPTFRAESIKLIDGDGYHVSSPPGFQFLPPGLTIKAVQDRLGPPERTTLLTVQTIGDRRPVILTLHTYAHGAISYAESDLAEPGVVDRVLLDLAIIIPVVSQ